MTSEHTPDTIGSRLERIARRCPDKIALTDGETEVSFRALDAAATAIARRILAATQGRDGTVCLLFANKAPAVGAIFGAGRSGRTYVPLDASDPEDRLRLIVDDSEPVAVLSEGPMLERAHALAPPGCVVIDIDHPGDPVDAGALPEVSADALVYLFYTSGSTGRPKGVGQTHRNLLFFVDAYARTLRIREDDRVSLLYSMSFSAANMDIFGALFNGATLCPYDLRRNGIRQLAGWLDRERISVLHAVPTVFRELVAGLAADRRLPHLRAVDLGGEALFGRDVELFREHTPEHCILVNHLAATEASVVAQHVIGHSGTYAADAMIPVGRCPEGLRVDIRRDDGSAADRNETGEMIIASPHVSPGYWRRPELNAEAFAVDPQRPGGRRYFSGDFGYIDDDGNLNFLGRRGSRIKLRGHSVELNEVEAALAACPGVTKVAVLAVGERSAEPDRLVAYLVTASEADRDPLRIRRHVATRLPAYMCPTGFVFLDELPLTASGKLDRKALQSMPTPESDASHDFEPPRDDVERTVAEIFQQLLNRAAIGRNDDFFLQGGDSLAAVELQARLRNALGASPVHFHEDATVAAIAASVRLLRETPARLRALPVLMPLWREGTAPPLFLVHGRHGQAFVSPHFMRLLGNDQPVWVFQARGLDGSSEPHSTVEAMAAEYVAEMRKVRPHGPYFLGALCVGALIAAEMACILRESGEAVLPLLLLDPRARPMQGDYRRLAEAPFADKMRARAAMGRIAGPVDDPSYMQAVVRTAMAFARAVAGHRARPYDGAAYMLASRERLGGTNGECLKNVFTGKVEQFEVAAIHAQVLDPRNPDFAARLAQCLELIHGAAHPDSPDPATRSSARGALTSSRAPRRRPQGGPMLLRNGPCPCGSGRRFKHCHGQLPDSGSANGVETVDFVVAGAQRSGTTALDLYLREHPQIGMPMARKELHFFDRDEFFRSDTIDYRVYHTNFLPRAPRQLRGETTPNYMYWEPTAERLARYNPAMKVVVILRNPITRAHSQWNKERQRGREALPFLDALRAEPERARDGSRLQILRTSYVDRGFYSRQLRHLWRYFPAAQTLILPSAELQEKPEATLDRVAAFLGLGAFPRMVSKSANTRQYEQPIGPDAWEYLCDVYAKEMRDLEQLLGWDCSPWRQMPR